MQLELISSHPHDQIHVLKQLLLDPLPEPTLGLEPEPLGRPWLSEIDRLWDVESEELPEPLPDDPLPLPLELDPVPADSDSLPERLRLSDDDVDCEPLETDRLEPDSLGVESLDSDWLESDTLDSDSLDADSLDWDSD